MNLLALTSIRHSIPSLQKLHQEGHLGGGLIMPDYKSEDILLLCRWANQQGIPFILSNAQQLEQLLFERLTSTSYDAIMVFGFPWRIPASVLNLSEHGFFNVHFSLLPAYRGPVPIFWQLRNGELTTGITIHRIDSNFDTGAIIDSITIPILPGENEGYCSARLGQFSVKLVSNVINNLGNDKIGKTQDESKASYFNRPTEADLAIDWNKHSSQQVQDIVNACNPIWQGALCLLNGEPIRILEVSPADGPDYPEQNAGTVIYADQQAGIFVICCDRKVIRLNILHTPEGIFSGGKLAAMGIGVGSQFENIITPEQINETQLSN